MKPRPPLEYDLLVIPVIGSLKPSIRRYLQDITPHYCQTSAVYMTTDEKTPNKAFTIYTFATAEMAGHSRNLKIKEKPCYVRNLETREHPESWFSSNCIYQQLIFKS